MSDGFSRTIFNPPYRREVRFRIGDYQTFLSAMRARVHEEMVTETDRAANGVETRQFRPLYYYYDDAPGQWMPALLAVWAEVGDILTFYQERIANEGYLGTAVEPGSVDEIFASVGLPAAVDGAAEAHVSFTASHLAAGLRQLAADNAPGPVPIPVGTLIGSIPDVGVLPAVFETTEGIDAHPEWNKLSARVATRIEQPAFDAHTTQLALEGVKTGLAAGDLLLMQGFAPSTRAPVSLVRKVHGVETNRRQGYTLVSWVEPLGAQSAAPLDDDDAPLLEDPTVLRFQQVASVFGYNAQPWAKQTYAVKRRNAPLQGGVFLSYDRGLTWSAANNGLPLDEPVAIAFAGGEPVVGLAKKGVFSRSLGADAFASSSRGITSSQVLCLAEISGALFVGCVGGGVYRSLDDGSTWQPLTGSPPTIDASTKQVTYHQLPRTNVHELAELDGDLFAATDVGLYRYDGQNWSRDGSVPAGEALTSVVALQAVKGIAGAAGAASGVYLIPSSPTLDTVATPPTPDGSVRNVNALAELDGLFLLAATDEGVFLRVADEVWLPLRGIASQLPDVPVVSLCCTGFVILAGTKDAGLYRSTNFGFSWQRVDVASAFPLASSFADDLDAGRISTALVNAFSAAGYGLENPVLSAGAPPGGPWQIDDDDDSYLLRRTPSDIEVYRQDAIPSVAAMAASSSGTLAATAPFSGFIAREWPGFELSPPFVDLAKSQPHVVAPGFAVVHQESASGDDVAASAIRRVSKTKASAFGVTGEVTRLELDDDVDLSPFDRRLASVHVQDSPVPLYRPTLPELTPVFGDTVELDTRLATPLPLPRTAIAVGCSLKATIAVAGGLLSLDAATAAASRPERVGLPNRTVCSLAVTPAGTVVAGTDEDGVFHLEPSSSDVTEASDGLPSGPVQALAATTSAVFAGTKQGVYVQAGSPPWTTPWSLSGLPGGDVQTLAVDDAGNVYAGTAAGGISRLETKAKAWSALPSLSSPVRTLALAGHTLVAGTASGVYARQGAGGWTELAGLPNTDVRAVVADEQGGITAATAGGVFRWLASTHAWTALEGGALEADAVNALLLDAGGALHAGAAGRGLCSWNDDDETWTALDTGVSNDVVALARGGVEGVWIGAADRSVVTAKDEPRTLSLTRTRLFSAPLSDPTLFSALSQGTVPSSLASLFGAHGIKLGDELSTSPTTAAGSWQIADGGTLYVVVRTGSSSAPSLIAFRSDATLRIGAPPVPVGAASSASRRWLLEDAFGFAGDIVAKPGEIVERPYEKGDPVVSEKVTIVDQSPSDTDAAEQSLDDETPTTLRLKEPLGGYYDAASFSLDANVVHVAQGQTAEETLGTGDASKENQRFSTTAPVSFATKGEGTKASSSLIVEVGGLPWSAVQSLVTAGSADHVYQVRYDAAGHATITFGDGTNGARLPNGRPVVARYRRRMGTQASCAAGRLKQLLSRPQTIRQVTNRAPAAPASDAPSSKASAATESGSSSGAAVTRALAGLRALDRIVSERDYVDFALTQPGVAKAVARVLWNGRSRLIHVTVGGTRGAPGAKVLRDATLAMEQARAPGLPLDVASYRPSYFRLKARVTLRAGRTVKEGTSAVEAALRTAFGYPAGALAAGLASADVVAVLQGVDGVAGVELQALYLTGETPRLRARIEGQAARWSASREAAVPATLLLLDPDEGAVALEVEAPQ